MSAGNRAQVPARAVYGLNCWALMLAQTCTGLVSPLLWVLHMPGLKAYATMPLWINTHWNATHILNLTLFFYYFIIYLMLLLCVGICVWTHVSWYIYGGQRMLSRVSSFLPPCESWGSNTGCPATSSLIPRATSVTLNLIFSLNVFQSSQI